MKATNDTGNNLIYEVSVGAEGVGAGRGVCRYVHTLFVLQTSLHYHLYS